MPRCQHRNAKMRLVIRTFVDLSTSVDRKSAAITRNDPADLHVEVTCQDCGFEGTYNAIGDSRRDLYVHAARASDWPKWLLAQMSQLAVADPGLRKALVACEVPGVIS